MNAIPEDDVASNDTLRAPFPWFGGKRRVAELVWSRLGNVSTYNEPFAGSLAVLLGRPHPPRIETVNDLDCYLSNFWRALQADPDQVAYWADYPVNETDLHARHQWLVDRTAFQAQMKADPDYFDAKIAGWWVWGQCLWIGSGWCQQALPPGRAGSRPHFGSRQGVHKKRMVGPGNGQGAGVHRVGIVEHKRPKLRERGPDGISTHQFDRNSRGTAHQARRPHLTSDQGALANRRWQGGGQGGGSGVHAPRLTQQKPLLRGDSGATGIGVHRKLPSLSQGGNDRSGNGRGIFTEGVRSEGLYEYLGALSARLRRVRVCCGDWTRILTPSVTTYIGICGVFLDPPYRHDLRERCYSEDHDISADVRAWAITNGDNPGFRIALCGYDGEHVMPETWDCVPWKAHGGYSRSARGIENRSKERIWFSPHCLKAEQGSLFAVEA